MQRLPKCLSIVVAAGLLCPVWAQSQGRLVLSEALAKSLITQDCLLCHGEEIITQQRLSEAAWERVLQKMRDWGAAVTPGDLRPLAAYLAEHYGPPSSPVRVSTVPASQAPRALLPEEGWIAAAPQELAQGAALYRQHCALCHESAGRGKLGPNLFTPLLTRRSGWIKMVRQGRNRMPAWQDKLSDSELAAIWAWLLEEAKKL